MELTRRTFVMGIALDEMEDGKVQITTQLYKPSPNGAQSGHGGKSGQDDKSFINIKTTEDSVVEAIRDIPIHIGRKAHWGHIRTILIGEELARNKGVGEFLEFFYRDHEPRITSSIAITKGKAADYLKIKPLVELTTGQQLMVNEKYGHDFSQKTIETNLLNLSLQLRSELSNSIVPFVYKSQQDSETATSVAGLALLKEGKLIENLPSENIESLQIIRNEYEDGMVSIPCNTQPEKVEVIEVLSSKTKLKPVVKDDALKVYLSIKMEAALQQLTCSKTDSPDNEKKFVESVEQHLEKQLKETVDLLIEKQFDAIELGNKVSKKYPDLWKRWKNNWDERFADSDFEFDVQVRIINSGTESGKSWFSNRYSGRSSQEQDE